MSDGNRHGANERDGKRKSCERLEVPDVAVPGKNLQALAGLPEPPEPGFTTKEAPLPPCSGLLARLQEFLPELEAANNKLERQLAQGMPQNEVDVEAIDPDKPHIEMDLGLGIVDLKTEEAVAAAQREAGDANILTQQQEPIDGSSLLESLICKPGPDETNENRAESLSTSAQDETAEPGRPSKASPMIEEL
mmetsp:Transcript_9071/g.33339  ORF Transcript_9071/g.33339 Transcript_9071/m.33339 type:complete len:192 (-) Transcript_9071:312-887(-)